MKKKKTISFPKKNINNLFIFFEYTRNLKSTTRALYTKTGKKESVAEHCFNLMIMLYTTAHILNFKINLLHALELAMFHDIAETITGDISAPELKDKEKKHRDEEKALQKITKKLPNTFAKKIKGLWEEYENGKTKEAKLVKAMDKIESLTQLAEEGHKYYENTDFMTTYGDKEVKKTPELLLLMEKAKQDLKKEFKKGGFTWKKTF